MSKLILILLFIFVSNCSKVISKETKPVGKISGKVVNKKSQLPIPFVNIMLLNTSIGTTTDDFGNFSLKNISVGTYNVRASHLEYKTLVKSDIVVTTSQTKNIVFELEENPIQTNEVVVSASLFNKQAEDVASVRKLNAEEIRRSPGASEDVNRLVQSLPGISFTSDSKNDLIVRGGSPSENLTIIDGIEFPNINHFGGIGSSGGGVSMVDVKYIDEINFYAGGFSPKYGDKLSSVMDIKLRDGNKENLDGGIETSIAGFGTFLEGPFLNENGSWILSYRKSFLDLILDAVQLTAVPNYQDVFTKFDYNINTINKLSLFAVGGIDKVNFLSGKNNESSFFDGIVSENNQYTIGVNWKYIFGKSGFSNLSISNSYNDFLVTQKDSLQDFMYKNISWEKETNLKCDITYNFNKQMDFNFGVGIKRNDFKHEFFLREDSVQFISANNDTLTRKFAWNSIKTDFGIKSSVYGNFIYNFTDDIKFNLGIRYDYFNYIENKHSISPRGSVEYKLNNENSVSFTYGIYKQFPVYSWLSITDYNLKLKPIQSEHYIFSYEKLIDDDKKFSVEVYDKEYKNYPVLLNNKYFSLIDAGSGFSDNISDSATNKGFGYSRGVDIFFQKKLSDKFYGLVSYSLSFTKVKAIEGGWRRGSYDSRNIVTLILGHKYSDDIELSFKFKYASSRPYIPYDESLSQNTTYGVLDYSKINSENLPSYHRLDLRFDKRWYFETASIVTFLEIQNAYNRQNVYMYYWNRNQNKKDTVYQWAFLPVGGFRLEF